MKQQLWKSQQSDSNEKSCKNNKQQPTQLNIYVFYDLQQI